MHVCAQVVWAKNDAQVTHLGAYNIARGIGARNFPNVVTGRANETVYGIPTLDSTSTTTGHVVLGYEFFQDGEMPITNTFSSLREYVVAASAFFDQLPKADPVLTAGI